VTNDIETLMTALYVKIDDELGGPRWVGRPPVLTDSELVCLAAAQALLGFTSEAHWLRYARKHLSGLFPYLPQQSGYNKRLRAALGLVKRVIRLLARSSDFWRIAAAPTRATLAGAGFALVGAALTRAPDIASQRRAEAAHQGESLRVIRSQDRDATSLPSMRC
jgi:hypothetical protein